jgi:hypothetical protein
MTDLIGGQVMMFSADFGVTVPQHKAGKIRGLAVTSMKRSAAVPELPTVNEALGLKDYELIAYFAVFAPAGTPPDTCREQAQRRHQRRGQQQGPAGQVRAIGFAIDPGTPEAAGPAQWHSLAETAKWAKAIRDAKIEPQSPPSARCRPGRPAAAACRRAWAAAAAPGPSAVRLRCSGCGVRRGRHGRPAHAAGGR